ncbi:2OG-Fe(II) oxygenase [Paracraurococcus lichenis]|uniref:2OG-Fe(II) oxygenase n=1 Tax=Paracraurococcus lichenis TaxID=3064888 RepID=A0ABT9E6K5_9PROT|nr:2OG-Fe(II) oxygenase [Paracraurococcus sp. LOR1-02]MDO9711817.1 2OG-Fe(II) oxygenase [Paracraurococcus sp. LOR1-02]
MERGDPPMPTMLAEPRQAAAETAGLLDLSPFRAAPRRDNPYPWVTASGCLRPEALPALRRDFPSLPRPGYHPLETFTAKGAFAALLAEIGGGALDRAMTEKFGIDFTALPRMVTVRQVSAAHEGRPHTDGARKVATLLLYMHAGWASPEGRIRVLRRESLEDPVAEVSPEEGNIFAFVRSDNSWHGHTPFVGERRVVQVTWLRDAAALDRKRRLGRLAWWLKGLFRRG